MLENSVTRKNAFWKKVFLLGTMMLLCVMCSVSVWASEVSQTSRLGTVGKMKLYDDAELLTESEEESLMQYGELVAQETGLQILIKTTDSTQGKEIRLYLADEYEKLGGTDKQPAILLGIDMGQREAAVVTSHASIDYFPVKRTNKMTDAVLDDLSNGDYKEAMEQFLKDSRDSVINYGVKPVGKIVGISFAVGLVLAAIIVGIMIWRHPKISNSQVSASSYLQGKSQIYNRKDKIISTHTSSRKIPTNQNNGRSSGGSFSSSSGGSYSGSSGRF